MWAGAGLLKDDIATLHPCFSPRSLFSYLSPLPGFAGLFLGHLTQMITRDIIRDMEVRWGIRTGRPSSIGSEGVDTTNPTPNGSSGWRISATKSEDSRLDP